MYKNNLLGEAINFFLSALTSAVIDFGLFAMFCNIFRTETGVLYVTVSAVLARLISATYNFFVNYKLVFKSNEKTDKAVGKYILLAIIQMCLSAGLTTYGVRLFTMMSEMIVKAVVDICLFVASFFIQKYIIFRKKQL